LQGRGWCLRESWRSAILMQRPGRVATDC